MQPAVEILPRVTTADVAELLRFMRAQDVAECRAVGLTDLRRAVVESVAASSMVWTARVDGKVAAIFGVAPSGTALAPAGAPWMLGTPLVAQQARVLVKHAKHYIAQMLNCFPVLANYVHARNTVSRQWLARSGFRLGPAEKAPTGEMFHRFEMEAVCASR